MRKYSEHILKKKGEKNGLSNIKKKSKPKLSPTYSDIM